MVRLGVVGVGGMGSAHAQTLKQAQIGEFVAVQDVRPEAVQRAAGKFGVQGFTDLADMLGQVDGIIVATPPVFHREAVVAAAERGVHVFCEKPLAADLADCEAMVAVCDAAGVVFMTGHVLRFYACHELGKRLVDEGVIGDLVYLETDYAWSFQGGRQKPESWYGTLGGFLENGIHKADLINWFGGPAESVAAEVGSWSGHDDWEDYAIALIRFASGCVGTLRWGPFLGARSNTDTILDGTKGSLRISIGQNRVWQKLLGEAEWTEWVPEGSVEEGVANELRHFVACIETGAPCRVDGREGRRAVELVLASYQSAREGTKVALPLMNCDGQIR